MPWPAARQRARARAGGLDASSYASWYAALIDLSLRLSGLGWRNALCETAFVARAGEGPAVRWRHGYAVNALAGLECALAAFPDARSICASCANAWATHCMRLDRRRRRNNVTSSSDMAEHSPRSWSATRAPARWTTACCACALRRWRGRDPRGRQRFAGWHAGQSSSAMPGRPARALHRQSGQPRLRRGLQPGRNGSRCAVAGVRQSGLMVEVDTLSRLRAHALARDGFRRRWLQGVDVAASTKCSVCGDEAARGGAIRISRRCCATPPAPRSWASRSMECSRCKRWMRYPARLMLLPRGAVRMHRRFRRRLSPACRGPGPVPARARAGATVAIANDVRVVHVRGVSSRARPLFVEWHKHRGLWRYFRKFEARSEACSCARRCSR
jgi:hypothetical protein